jgi:ABC-2 type transport system permease protein
MSRPWLVVARREFHERVRTIWFVVVTVLGPLGMVGLALLPAWVGSKTGHDVAKIDVIDHSGLGLAAKVTSFAPLFKARVDLREVPPTTSETALLERIRSQAIKGYMVIPAAVLEDGKVTYRGENAANFTFSVRLSQVLNAAIMGERARDAGLDPAKVGALLRPIDLDTKHTTGEGEAKSATQSYVVAITVMLVLYMAILLYAVNVMRSVVQEKSSRVVEIVVSATRPASLMLGKVVGVGLVGLLQLGLWAATAILIVHFRGGLLAMLGVSDSGQPLVDLSLADVGVVLAYFVGGYFFYAALYAGLGAMVNSDQEAQQVQMPVVLLLVASAALAQNVANDPRGMLAQILTILPFSAPVLMPMRWTLDSASVTEVVTSLAFLALCTFGVVYLAGRVYRIGILMYGKRPTARELVRWLRHG